MGISDRKYMANNDHRQFMVNGGSNTITTKLVFISAVLFLIDAFTNGQLTKLLCLNPKAVYNFEIWRMFTPIFMTSAIESTVTKILTLVIIYLAGNNFEQIIGKKNYLNFIICVTLGQSIVAVLIPFNIYIGYLSGLLSGIFIAYGVILGSRKMTMLLFFIIPLTLSGYMLIAFTVGILILLTLANLFPWQYAIPIISGCFASYVYITQFQKGSPIDLVKFFKNLFKINNKNKVNSNQSRNTTMNSNQAGFRLVQDEKIPDEKIEDLDSYISENIDPILDKIAKSGMSSLTPEEKKILDNAKKRLSR